METGLTRTEQELKKKSWIVKWEQSTSASLLLLFRQMYSLAFFSFCQTKFWTESFLQSADVKYSQATLYVSKYIILVHCTVLTNTVSAGPFQWCGNGRGPTAWMTVCPTYLPRPLYIGKMRSSSLDATPETIIQSTKSPEDWWMPKWEWRALRVLYFRFDSLKTQTLLKAKIARRREEISVGGQD